jgi:alpha-galactosidase
MAMSRGWTGRFLSAPADLPVSFRLGGRKMAGIPETWEPSSRRRRIDASIVETVFEGREAESGLAIRVECQEYLDHPVVEWTAWFTNAGEKPTPILSDILALDSSFAGTRPLLWHCNGDFYSGEGYTSRETPVCQGTPLTFAPAGGRPCDRVFPYYRLMFKGGGLSIAIGWPGQWSASFASAADCVRITAGQQTTHLRLMPGETIRTPRIALMSWSGDAGRAANLWRRWHRAHLLPRPDGRPLGPMLVGHGTDDAEEFTAATEANQIEYMERWAKRGMPIDVWWIDAGWYPCRNKDGIRKWPETGTWVPDPERFPNGFKPVSDCAASHAARLLVWFEPERVRPGSQLDREHPEWLLKADGTENRLLNLGDPAAWQWLTDHICTLIRENGVRIYRQDFNFEPLQYWRQNDAEDRQGITENLHVQGYLEYWDDLLARNPGLWIDSCASGGRRNDLETMRRSVPLHYTDFGYGDHPVKLSFHDVMFQWLPYFKEVTLSWDLKGQARYDHRVDGFSWHCGLGPMIIPCIDIRRDDYDYDLMRRMIPIWRRAADLMLHGDYYPLTPIHRTAEKWVARQFDCPQRGIGFIQAIRLPQCPDDTLLVHPQAIRTEETYVFENPETGEIRQQPGQALRQDGLALTCLRREGIIWFYRASRDQAG